ncbi:MAG: GNAT family protein [Chloroflexota bacterium]
MIYGNRIRLRAIERSDLPLFVRWLNDPEVRLGLQMYLPLSQNEEELWYEGMMKRPAEEHPLLIEIETPKGWVPVGNCGFLAPNWRLRKAEIGIFIGDKKYWNQGYGSEVMRLALKLGFESMNLNRISLQVFTNNPRAIRAYEKVGFVHEGRLRQAHYDNGQYHDILIMSVLRSEWQSS